MEIANKIINVEPLSDNLLVQVEGGSELTDSIWYGIGYVAGALVKAAKNITQSTPATGGNATWADK